MLSCTINLKAKIAGNNGIYDLGLQIIFTTTLKTEEIGKYSNHSYINHIDYSNHMPSKMLDASYLPEFQNIISKLAITI